MANTEMVRIHTYNTKEETKMKNEAMNARNQLPGGGFHGGEQQTSLPGGGFHGGEQQVSLPGGGFHGGEQQVSLPGGGFHGGEQQVSLPGGGFHGGEQQTSLPGGGFHQGDEQQSDPSEGWQKVTLLLENGERADVLIKQDQKAIWPREDGRQLNMLIHDGHLVSELAWSFV